MNLTLYFENILYEYIFISSKNNRQCPCSICVQRHPWVYTNNYRAVSDRQSFVRGRLWLREAHLWERLNGSGSFPQAGKLHRMKGADSVRQLVQAFFQSASWLPQAPHQDGLESLCLRDSFLLWSLLSGILLHSWKVLTNSTFHCMNTRKMQKAVQAAKVGEGREGSEWSRGKWGFWCCPCYFQTKSSWLSKLPSTFLRLK